jgi:hypothetical protein
MPNKFSCLLPSSFSSSRVVRQLLPSARVVLDPALTNQIGALRVDCPV